MSCGNMLAWVQKILAGARRRQRFLLAKTVCVARRLIEWAQSTIHESRVTIVPRSRYNRRVKQRLEHAALWLLLKIIGALPRPLARFVGAAMLQ
jgi:hypothetical protein